MCELCWTDRPSHPASTRRHFLRAAAASAAAVAAAAAVDVADVAAAAQPSGKSSGFAKVKTPTIVTREQWGADETIRDPKVVGWAPFRKIVVHHTASPNNVKDPAKVVRFGYRLHVEDRGFTDIGYHFLISPDGQIFEGRRARKYGPRELHNGEDGAGNGIIGGHTKGRNAGTLGICLMGNFMKAKPSLAALESLIHLSAWEAQRHKIDPLGSDEYIGIDGRSLAFANIAPHRDVRATLCPGGQMAKLLPWVRQEVAARVGSFPARKADMRRLAWIINPG